MDPKLLKPNAPIMDLIAQGTPLGVIKGRELVEIPSIAFVYKCEQTRLTHDVRKQGPLPPS